MVLNIYMVEFNSKCTVNMWFDLACMLKVFYCCRSVEVEYFLLIACEVFIGSAKI